MQKKLKVLDLFSGIGGFSLGLERTGGFETVAFMPTDIFDRGKQSCHQEPSESPILQAGGAKYDAQMPCRQVSFLADCQVSGHLDDEHAHFYEACDLSFLPLPEHAHRYRDEIFSVAEHTAGDSPTCLLKRRLSNSDDLPLLSCKSLGLATPIAAANIGETESKYHSFLRLISDFLRLQVLPQFFLCPQSGRELAFSSFSYPFCQVLYART